MKKPSLLTAEQILADHKPAVRALVNKIRTTVKKTIPDAEERVYPVWRGIGFRHKEAGYFCGAFLYEDSVKVYFEHGKVLPDPDHLFTGKGSQTGQILIRTSKDIRVEPFKNLLKESIEFRKSFVQKSKIR
ncbi:MAG: DUF1801 domain-containing protein [Ignavibacteriae bacterium]|nr:DUF1801 domain-containing protein [Ignavibacteriota bacterium]